MPHNVTHFAVDADDIDRAKRFYEKTFGWSFQAWGPPGFFMIQTGTPKAPGIHGSLQSRNFRKGEHLRAFECTLGVDDVDKMSQSIKKNGGQILHPEMVIPGVGRLIQFSDTEGNIVSAMHYDADAK